MRELRSNAAPGLTFTLAPDSRTGGASPGSGSAGIGGVTGSSVTAVVAAAVVVAVVVVVALVVVVTFVVVVALVVVVCFAVVVTAVVSDAGCVPDPVPVSVCAEAVAAVCVTVGGVVSLSDAVPDVSVMTTI